MTKAERHAVATLAGCPTGATKDALKACGIAKKTLEDLVARGILHRRTQVMACPRGMVLIRYFLRVV
jgi:hypothetical protein